MFFRAELLCLNYCFLGVSRVFCRGELCVLQSPLYRQERLRSRAPACACVSACVSLRQWPRPSARHPSAPPGGLHRCYCMYTLSVCVSGHLPNIPCCRSRSGWGCVGLILHLVSCRRTWYRLAPLPLGTAYANRDHAVGAPGIDKYPCRLVLRTQSGSLTVYTAAPYPESLCPSWVRLGSVPRTRTAGWQTGSVQPEGCKMLLLCIDTLPRFGASIDELTPFDAYQCRTSVAVHSSVPVYFP